MSYSIIIISHLKNLVDYYNIFLPSKKTYYIIKSGHLKNKQAGGI